MPVILLPDLARRLIHAEQPALQRHHGDADPHLAKKIALGTHRGTLGNSRADGPLQPRFAQDGQSILRRITCEYAARSFGAQPCGRRVGGNRLEARICDAVVCVEDTRCNLDRKSAV